MKNLTPNALRCGYVAECPAVYEAPDGSIVVIGEVKPEILEQLKGKVGATEMAVVIKPEFFANVPQFKRA